MLSGRVRKAIKQRPVERLMLQLIGNPPDVFLGHGIVAGLVVRAHGHFAVKRKERSFAICGWETLDVLIPKE
jgi:hypothetical protein